jgi:hypothetical protein
MFYPLVSAHNNEPSSGPNTERRTETLNTNMLEISHFTLYTLQMRTSAQKLFTLQEAL